MDTRSNTGPTRAPHFRHHAANKHFAAAWMRMPTIHSFFSAHTTRPPAPRIRHAFRHAFRHDCTLAHRPTRDVRRRILINRCRPPTSRSTASFSSPRVSRRTRAPHTRELTLNYSRVRAPAFRANRSLVPDHCRRKCATARRAPAARTNRATAAATGLNDRTNKSN